MAEGPNSCIHHKNSAPFPISRVGGHVVFDRFHFSGNGVYQELQHYFRLADYPPRIASFTSRSPVSGQFPDWLQSARKQPVNKSFRRL
jgi:hypothetical protein